MYYSQQVWAKKVDPYDIDKELCMYFYTNHKCIIRLWTNRGQKVHTKNLKVRLKVKELINLKKNIFYIQNQ